MLVPLMTLPLRERVDVTHESAHGLRGAGTTSGVRGGLGGWCPASDWPRLLTGNRPYSRSDRTWLSRCGLRGRIVQAFRQDSVQRGRAAGTARRIRASSPRCPSRGSRSSCPPEELTSIVAID